MSRSHPSSISVFGLIIKFAQFIIVRNSKNCSVAYYLYFYFYSVFNILSFAGFFLYFASLSSYTNTNTGQAKFAGQRLTFDHCASLGLWFLSYMYNKLLAVCRWCREIFWRDLAGFRPLLLRSAGDTEGVRDGRSRDTDSMGELGRHQICSQEQHDHRWVM